MQTEQLTESLLEHITQQHATNSIPSTRRIWLPATHFMFPKMKFGLCFVAVDQPN